MLRGSSASWPGRSTGCAGSTGSGRGQCLAARPPRTCSASSPATRSSGAGWTFSTTTAITLPSFSTRTPPVDPERLWFLGGRPPTVVAEVLAASDLHVAPGRPYPVARSLLEAMAAGCVVLAVDTEPHREVISHGQTGLLADVADPDALHAPGAGRAGQPGRIPAAGRRGGRAGAGRAIPRMSACPDSPSSSRRSPPREPGGSGRERPVHPRRLPRPVRPARPRACHAPRLEVQLPGAEPLELPDADARDAPGSSSCTRCR